MKKLWIFLAVLAISGLSAEAQNKTKPVIASGNLTTKNQLWESVGNGIHNYQADVMYIYGKLFVTPVMPDSANHKLPTLTDAYLYPLYNLFKKNSGEIVPGYPGDVFLILNITAQPVQVYRQLAAEMRPFAEMLSYKIEGAEQKGKLRILIKDKLQLEKINAVKPGFLSIVGNMSDIDKNVDSAVMPLIEVDFNEITAWRGTGNIPFEDFTKIKNLVAKVHAQNKKISLINCPAYKTIAELVQVSGLDFVNTPEPARLSVFF